MNKKKKITVVVLIAVSLLIAGCTVNEQKIPTTGPRVEPSVTTVQQTTTSAPTKISDEPTRISSIVNNTSQNKSQTGLTTTDADWCKIGASKVISGKTFTIKDVKSENGTALCYAESITPDGKTSYYFDKNNTIKRMSSVSSTNKSNASASANISIKTS